MANLKLFDEEFCLWDMRVRVAIDVFIQLNLIINLVI